ncbi:hypothetical protein H6P81_020296 [Aristolochia fimbriata]|uniref:Uncharacterized protein n=1 Tax=Aristolochia fimbriata TaxID=158543 RepID=A0AAV7DX13_ARIFI|nr:hypothetical protein H6P81_020296 [Aristolochia fimbriata]
MGATLKRWRAFWLLAFSLLREVSFLPLSCLLPWLPRFEFESNQPRRLFETRGVRATMNGRDWCSALLEKLTSLLSAFTDSKIQPSGFLPDSGFQSLNPYKASQVVSKGMTHPSYFGVSCLCPLMSGQGQGLTQLDSANRT